MPAEAERDVRRDAGRVGTRREPDHARRTGFRPSSRRRTRMAVGALLIALAVGGNVVVYTSLDSRTPVLQVVRDVPAGERLTSDDVRPVEVAADPSVRTVSADALPTVVGSYARVRLVSGSLVVEESLQPTTLVAPGAAVVAIQVPDGSLPLGLRERSELELVVPPPRGDESGAPTVVRGIAVGLPGAPQSVSGRISLSVEVEAAAAPPLAAADDVRVVLVEPEGGG